MTTHQQRLESLQQNLVFKKARLAHAQLSGRDVEAAQRAYQNAKRELANYQATTTSATVGPLKQHGTVGLIQGRTIGNIH